MEVRRLSARVRVALAILGAVLVIADPGIHSHPFLAVLGWAVIAATGGFHAALRSDYWLRIDEGVACAGGVLLITMGPDRVTDLTMLWLACVTLGVVARGGRVGPLGRVLVIAVLLSPMARFGITGNWVSLAAAGGGLLLVAGRISVEISDLLRDPLTGVVSRAVLDGQLAQFAAAAGPGWSVALIMLDLDDFGAVNKNQGYAAGDLLLVRAVESIAVNLGAEEVLGRLGGDEFAVIASGPHPMQLAARIVESLAQAGISASAGVAEAPGDGGDPRALKLAADLALRLSKQSGKGRVSAYSRLKPDTPARSDPSGQKRDPLAC